MAFTSPCLIVISVHINYFTLQNWVPTREEREVLFLNKLGEKKITFKKNSSSDDFRESIIHAYRQLGETGFEVCVTKVLL